MEEKSSFARVVGGYGDSASKVSQKGDLVFLVSRVSHAVVIVSVGLRKLIISDVLFLSCTLSGTSRLTRS